MTLHRLDKDLDSNLLASAEVCALLSAILVNSL